jgi:putative colanic acid biosysnthesis UDP-glucose lipid carrier transferase
MKYHSDQHSSIVRILSQLIDFIIIEVVGFILFKIFVGANKPDYLYIYAFLLVGALSFFIFPNFNFYKSWRGKKLFILVKHVFAAHTLLLAIGLAAAVFFKLSAHFSRVWMLSWYLGSTISLVTLRVFAYFILSKMRLSGLDRKRVMLYGTMQLSARVLRELREKRHLGFDITYFIASEGTSVEKPVEFSEFNSCKMIDENEILNNLKENQIHEFWLALPLREDETVKRLQLLLRHQTLVIRYIPDIYSFFLLNYNFSSIGELPAFELNGSALSPFEEFLKRFEDITIALCILIGIIPVMLCVALAIRLESKGPIIFKQKRNGKNGSIISVYKFRSMFLHEEKGKEVTQATKNDARITKVGKFIRKTSLDELPQFINVLQGRMSVVGPRPHALAHNELYKDQVYYYMQRHKVKPGITGWAQINGYRGETDTLEKMQKRVEFDLYYIQNWSLLFDLKIVFLTIFKGFVDKNAY